MDTEPKRADERNLESHACAERRVYGRFAARRCCNSSTVERSDPRKTTREEDPEVNARHGTREK